MKRIDYAQALYSFKGIKKHFISDSAYYIYIFEDKIIMSNKQENSDPKYIFPLTILSNLGWIVKLVENKIIYQAFTFTHRSHLKQIYAQSIDIEKMKKLVSNKVSFIQISTFYDPINILGKGASAKVLLAKDYLTCSNVAIKAIDKAYLNSSSNGMAGFLSEIEIMQALSQYPTNFLHLKEVFEGEKTYYLILNLMEGKTLQDQLEAYKDQNSLISHRKVKILVKKLLEGCQIMHSKGIIHRDLKPDNLMLQNDQDYSSLTIGDFGLATFTNVPAYKFPKCGTPGFVAPEILNLKNNNQKYGTVADIFSCGCIFYKLVTGKSLFKGEDFEDVLKENKKCQIDYSANVFQDLPQNTKDLLKKLLQYAPENRITAKEALLHPYFFEEENTGEMSSPVTKLLTTNKFIDNNNQPKKLNIGGEEEFSPFQKRAIKNYQQQVKDSVDSMISEMPANYNSIEKTLKEYQFPPLKKPSFNENNNKFKLESSQKISTPVSPDNSPQHKNSLKNTMQSFYMKDPLSPLKNIKNFKKQNAQEKERLKMKKISLFEQNRKSSDD